MLGPDQSAAVIHKLYEAPQDYEMYRFTLQAGCKLGCCTGSQVRQDKSSAVVL